MTPSHFFYSCVLMSHWLYVEWTPELMNSNRSGEKLLTTSRRTAREKKWQKVCREAGQSIYIGVRGIDLDLSKGAFRRDSSSEILEVEAQP